MPALVIATYRDDELARDHPLRVVLGELSGAHRMTVEPLSAGAVARLAAAHGVDGAALHARTGGNPFFVTEVLARGGGEHARQRARRRARPRGAPARSRAAAAGGRGRRAAARGDLAARADRAGRAAGARGVPGVRDAARRGRRGRASATRSRARRSRTSFRPTGTSPCIGRRWPPWSGAASRRGSRITPRRPATAPPCSSTPRRRASARRGSAPTARPPPTSPPRCGTRTASRRRRARRCSNGAPHACFLSGMIQEAVDAETLALEIYVATGDRLREGDAHRWLARARLVPGRRRARRASRPPPPSRSSRPLPPGRELALAYGSARDEVHDGVRPRRGRASGARRRSIWRSASARRRCSSRRSATSGRSSWPTGWPRAARSCCAASSSRSTRGLERPRGGRATATSWRAPTTYATTRRRWRSSTAGRAFCDEHDLLAWDIYLGGWEARIALDHGRWAEAAALAAREPRAHARLAAAQPVPLAARRSGVLHARRGDADPWPELDEALAIAVAANELDTLGPVGCRAGGGALARRRGRLGRGGDRRRAGARASAATIAG